MYTPTENGHIIWNTSYINHTADYDQVTFVKALCADAVCHYVITFEVLQHICSCAVFE